MKYYRVIFVCLFCMVFTMITVTALPSPDAVTIPLAFISNEGQFDDDVGFYAIGQGSDIVFSNSCVYFIVTGPEDSQSTSLLTFPGSEEGVTPVGINTLDGKANYFLGNDPDNWITEVPCYEKIVYQSLYPGIDLVYSGDYGRLKSEFVVAPGADPDLITLKYEGAERIYIDPSGCLIIETSSGQLMEAPLLCYQETSDEILDIPATYDVGADGAITLNIGTYDPSLPLVIDPEIVYSTYFGGYNSEYGKGIVVDSQGNMYVTGQAYSSNLPVINAYQASIGTGGWSDAFVTKLSADGSSLVYSTFLGGSGLGTGERGYGIAIDNSGNAYITGVTDSTNFPVKNAYKASLSTNPFGGQSLDAFVTKLAPTGSSLIYSTYLGSPVVDWGYGIVVDDAGCAYVTGYTEGSGALGNFPLKNAYQSSSGGMADVFVTKFSADGSSLVYSTYLGGNQNERGYGIALDSQGCAYITGGTHSTNFPTENAFESQYGGVCDAFVTKLSATGTSLLYSTYLGGNDDDYAYGIAIDLSGCSYVTGITLSSDFPTSNAYQSSYSGGTSDAFVTKFNSAGNLLSYSTYLGGNGRDYGKSLCVDSSGNAYVTGHTESSNFPLMDPVQSSFGGGQSDAFITKLDSGGDAIGFSTYLGGSDIDEGWCVTLGPSGTIYTTGMTKSTDFPTKNPYQALFAGTNDAYIVKLDLGGTVSPPVAAFFADVTSGFKPLTVTFTDQSTGSPTSWSWTFGDGTTSTQQNPVHTYTSAGTYTVSLIVSNAGGSDTETKTSYISVNAPTTVTADFIANMQSGLAPLTVQFTDLSTGSPTSWSWDFGDGNTSAQQNPVHTYGDAGDYTVSLTASKTGSSDTEVKTAYISVYSSLCDPQINWQKCLGGTGSEMAFSIQQTADGGYIVVGNTISNDGDVSGNHGEEDFWIVKLDSVGNIIWQKCLGGTGSEKAYSVQQTVDGGYIITGYTRSNDGDVTGNHGGEDFWIVKLDNSGNTTWQKCLGGTGYEIAYSVQQTADGGYIVAGKTLLSNNGDVSGIIGNWDIWVVKLDSSGSIIWQKCLGGTDIETAYSIQQTTDGGYILTGYTESEDGDVSGNHGGEDLWVVKLDSTGSITWQKCLGGTYNDGGYSVQQTGDGGYIVAGNAYSNDGNVSGNHGMYDSWIVKLDDIGNVVWQKCLGGSNYDFGYSPIETVYSIQQTTDGGYIVTGNTRSNNDGDVSGRLGGYDYDYWVMKLDNAGNLSWQKCLGGTGVDDANSIQQTNDGEYIIAGYSSSNDADVSVNHGAYDFWIVKLADCTTPLSFPPSCVINLHNTTYQQNQITWVWTDPADAYFDHVMIYIDGVFQTNITGGIQAFTATGLSPATPYVISTHTVGTTGLVNFTWVNHTATTAPLSPDVPIAQFTADATFVIAPFTIHFTDQSTGSPTSWAWNFGDGGTSTQQNPIHAYNSEGVYDVTLTVTNTAGNSTITKPGYITVSTTSNSTTYDTYVFTHSDLLLFSYSDGTYFQVYNTASSLLWAGTLNAGEHKALTSSDLLSSGIFHIQGTQPYSVLAGDMLSNTMMGYYAKDSVGRGLSTKFYTYQHDTIGAPPDLSNFIVFAYENTTSVQITDSETGAVIWSGELDEGEHHAEPTLSNIYLTVTSSKPVSALCYTDQGYYIPASSGTFTGTKFYSWTGSTGSWRGWSLGVYDLNIIAYSNDTEVSVTNTETGALIWSGTLDAGAVKSISFSNAQYVTITANKDVNAGFFPYGSWNQAYLHLVQVQDSSGKGIGTLFYSPTTAKGTMVIFSFADSSLVNVTRSDGTEIWNGYLDEGDYNQVTLPTKGVYTITGSKPVAIVYYEGSQKGSDFAPLYYSIISSPVINAISPANMPAGSESFTLTVTGTNFISGSTVRWNGSDRVTTFVSSNRVDASIPASDIITEGTADVTVYNPDLGLISNSKTFSIDAVPVNPGSVANLHNTTYLPDLITWVWTDPADADFDHVMVYIDGVFQENVTKGTEAFTASSLLPATSYTIGTRTVGTTGLVDDVWVNHTATTASEPAVIVPPNALFALTPSFGYAPMTVQFTDYSTGAPSTWEWDFGDGSTSTEQNPSHTYPTAGRFVTTLTVYNQEGSDSYSAIVWVRAAKVVFPTYSKPSISTKPVIAPRPGYSPISFFSMSPIIGFAPMTVHFTDMSFNNPMTWQWDFGDGHTSTIENPINIYTESGVYTVTLKTTNENGESTTSRRVYVR